jgi:hypothetical protein
MATIAVGIGFVPFVLGECMHIRDDSTQAMLDSPERAILEISTFLGC